MSNKIKLCFCLKRATYIKNTKQRNTRKQKQNTQTYNMGKWSRHVSSKTRVGCVRQGKIHAKEH